MGRIVGGRFHADGLAHRVVNLGGIEPDMDMGKAEPVGRDLRLEHAEPARENVIVDLAQGFVD